MESALEEIEFLARSSNRVDVLKLLTEKRHTRNALADATGASQATLGRILQDLEDRTWIKREDGKYAATATGRLVTRGFINLLDILETEHELRAIVQYLPTHAMSFDLAHLADAKITVPTETRPDAPVQRLLELEGNTDDVRSFSHAFNEQSIATIQERTTTGELTFRGVFSQTAIDAITDDWELQRRLVAILEVDDSKLRTCEEGLPLAATIADDVVHLLLRDENGVLQASIDTDAQAVRTWAHNTFDHYWRTAKPLEPEDLLTQNSGTDT